MSDLKKRFAPIVAIFGQARNRVKGGGGVRLELQPDMMPGSYRDVDLLALDEPLDALSQLDERRSRVVELRFFTGLSIEDTAEVLATSPATVKRDEAVGNVRGAPKADALPAC